MAEKYKIKKVTDFPEASTLDGFYAFGTDGSNNSVKVPIGMLRGNSPHVGANGNWYLGDIDTGVHAQGEPGKDANPMTQTITDESDTVPSNFAVNVLKKQLYGNGVITEVIPYQSTTVNRFSIIGFGSYAYNDQTPIKGKYINSVRVNIETAGTFTVSYGINVNSSSFSQTWSKTFQVTKGENILKIERRLESDEWLFFSIPSDTCQFRWDINTAIQGGFMSRLANASWSNSTGGNLSIGVSILEGADDLGDILKINNRIDTLSNFSLTDKIVSIMGDSISTYNGYIPSGNQTFFPSGAVNSVDKTWWKMLIDEFEMILGINESWSGSRLTNTTSTTSNFTNQNRYGHLGEADIIFNFGGTNDFGSTNTPKPVLGEFNLVDSTRNLAQFKQAYQFLIEEQIRLYPSATIFIIVPPIRTDFTIFQNNTQGWSQNDLKIALYDLSRMYGVEIIDLWKCGINHTNGATYLLDGLHPNSSGMVLIKNYIANRLKIRFQ